MSYNECLAWERHLLDSSAAFDESDNEGRHNMRIVIVGFQELQAGDSVATVPVPVPCAVVGNRSWSRQRVLHALRTLVTRSDAVWHHNRNWNGWTWVDQRFADGDGQVDTNRLT